MSDPEPDYTVVVVVEEVIQPVAVAEQGPQGPPGPTGATGATGATGPAGGVSSVSGTAPIVSSGGATPAISISAATTTAVGAVELATDGETASGVVVQGNDGRLSNARTPTTHATSHATGGSDPVTPAAIGAAPLASPSFTGTVRVPGSTTAGAVDIAATSATTTGFRIDSTLGLVFVLGGTDRWRISSTSQSLVPSTTNTVDLGATVARVRAAYLQSLLSFARTGTPEGSLSGSPGDLTVDATTGRVWAKGSGAATTTGWLELARLSEVAASSHTQTASTISDLTTATQATAVGGELSGTVVDASVLGNPLWSHGGDGNVSISGTVTLTRNMNYNTLTVPAGQVLDTNGFMVFARTLTGSGTIRSNGGNGAAAGTAGTGTTAGFVGTSFAGGAGGTVAGTASTAAANSCQVGAQGGAGGLGSGGAGGTAGTLSTITAAALGSATLSQVQPATLALGRVWPDGASPRRFIGGGGGGGGGGDGTAGGGGGGGGGIVFVFARDASGWTGTIQANGGNGGTPPAGNRGGGGGGGGGAAVLVCRRTPTGGHTIQATGGSGGSPSGTGVAGSNGSAGTAFVMQV